METFFGAFQIIGSDFKTRAGHTPTYQLILGWVARHGHNIHTDPFLDFITGGNLTRIRSALRAML